MGGTRCVPHRRGVQPWSTDCAALCPGMPLTPPPRRAPAPASAASVVGRLDAPGAHLVVVLGPGPLQRAVEDVAAGQADGPPRGRPGCGPRCTGAVGVAEQHRPRWARPSTESSESQGARRAPGPRGACSLSAAEQPRRQVQAEEGQRLRVARGEVGPEDRAVRQAVAVDLARRQVGSARRAAAAYASCELGVALVDVEGAGERRCGVDGLVAQDAAAGTGAC